MRFDDILTEKFLREEYLEKQKGVYEISKEVGCTPHTIYLRLKRFAIQQNRNSSDITNKKSNMLTAIKVVGRRKNKASIWLCKCDCGNETKIDIGQFNSGHVKSCGCILHRSGEKHHLWNGYKEISGHVWSTTRNGANKRNIEFNIEIEYCYNLFQQQNRKCVLSGISISLDNNGTASLDRIDSSKPYEVGNVWWVHNDINRIKSYYSLDKFLEICKLVSEDRVFRPKQKKPIIYKSHWSHIIYQAKRRNIELSITKEYAEDILQQQGLRCYLSGMVITLAPQTKSGRKNKSASLDRIDSNLGYIEGNVAWCHKDINQSKSNFSIEYYKELCKKVVNNHVY